MNNNIRNRSFFLLLIFSLICVFAFPAQAKAACSVSIPVSVRNVEEVPGYEETHTLILKREATGNPLPEGAVDNEYTIDIHSSGSDKFELSFDEIGVYTYTIRQQKGTNDYCVYDKRIYKLKVSVVYGSSGEPEAIAVLLPDENTTKQSEALFENIYDSKTIMNLSNGNGQNNAVSEEKSTEKTTETESETESETETETDKPVKEQTTNSLSGTGSASQGASASDSGIPKTGDASDIALWLSLLAASCLIMILGISVRLLSSGRPDHR